MQRDHATLLSITRETFRCESFTGSHPLQVFVVDTQLSLPIAVKDRRIKSGHARCVGIALRCDIYPACPSFANHFQNARSVVESHAGYLNNVQWSTGHGGCRKDFLKSSDTIHRLLHTGISHMHMTRCFKLCSYSKHLDDFSV